MSLAKAPQIPVLRIMTDIALQFEIRHPVPGQCSYFQAPHPQTVRHADGRLADNGETEMQGTMGSPVTPTPGSNADRADPETCTAQARSWTAELSEMRAMRHV